MTPVILILLSSMRLLWADNMISKSSLRCCEGSYYFRTSTGTVCYNQKVFTRVMLRVDDAYDVRRVLYERLRIERHHFPNSYLAFDMTNDFSTWTWSSTLYSNKNGIYGSIHIKPGDIKISDSSEGKTGKIYSQNGATIIDGRSSTDTAKITIESGSIQGSGNLGSSAITVGKGDSFYMNGGTICDFKADNGAAVYAEACWFEMKAGTIRNCQATENGGAIAYSLAISGGQVVPMLHPRTVVQYTLRTMTLSVI